jgi:hypothetical protein
MNSMVKMAVEQAAVRGFIFPTPHFRRHHAPLRELPAAHRPCGAERKEKVYEHKQRKNGTEKYEVGHEMEWLGTVQDLSSSLNCTKHYRHTQAFFQSMKIP